MSIEEPKQMELAACIGQSGNILNGLKLHPDGKHMLQTLGSSLVVRNLEDKSVRFFNSSDKTINTFSISPSGRQVAAGQKSQMGFKAKVFLWDFEDNTLVKCWEQHQVEVSSLAFSPSEKQLTSMGGVDDGSIYVYKLTDDFAPLCKAREPGLLTNQLRFFNNSDEKIISVHNQVVQIWTIDAVRRNVTREGLNMGNIKREYTCIVLNEEDTLAYCGTRTGDVVILNIETKRFIFQSDMKLKNGIRCLSYVNKTAGTDQGQLLLGSGDGKLTKFDIWAKKPVKSVELQGSVSSVSCSGDMVQAFVSTAECNIQLLDIFTMTKELRQTAHHTAINDVVFHKNFDQIFLTASAKNIRIWDANSYVELTRVEIPGVECLCIGVSIDGTSVVSGWTDGKIRAFAPKSGKLLQQINDAHNHGVSSIVCLQNGGLISGGAEGEIRVWSIDPTVQRMKINLKEHRSLVSCIILSADDKRGVSVSTDGSCIFWDLENYARLGCMFEKTMFKQVVQNREEFQCVTTGSARNISQWDIEGGECIRMVEGSTEGEINTLAITESGEHMISGGDDKVLKVWDQDQGQLRQVGLGHSVGINKCVIAPSGLKIISVGQDGAIMVWKTPEEVLLAKQAESE